MSVNELAWLDELLRTSLIGQFPDFQPIATELPDLPKALVGQIGFRTKCGVGSLGVVASAETLRSLEPLLTNHAIDVGDWIGELANQTLGRIKLDLAALMSDVISSTPVVLRETCLCMSRTEGLRTFRLERIHESLGIWIDLAPITIEPGTTVLEPVDNIVGAGESLLFF